MKELKERLFEESRALREKAWTSKSYEESIKYRKQEQPLYEKYVLLKGIIKAQSKLEKEEVKKKK